MKIPDNQRLSVDIPIGEEIEYRGNFYKCVADTDWEHCDVCDLDTEECKIFKCFDTSRKDATNVYFKFTGAKIKLPRKPRTRYDIPAGMMVEYRGAVYKCVADGDSSGCDLCAWGDNEPFEYCHLFRCVYTCRKDCKNVHFELVEEGGEA